MVLEVRITTLHGPTQHVAADAEWRVRDVKQSLQLYTGIELDKLHLRTSDGQELCDGEILGNVAGGANIIELTLIQQSSQAAASAKPEPSGKAIEPLSFASTAEANAIKAMSKAADEARHQPALASSKADVRILAAAPAGSMILPPGTEVIPPLFSQSCPDLARRVKKSAPALVKRANEGRIAQVRCLLEDGEDKDQCDKTGVTPLIAAASQGHLESVRFLCEAGANKDKTELNGFTALHVASGEGHVEVVRLLSGLGASHAITDRRGTTPLHAATVSRHLEVVRILCGVHADLESTTLDGWTPLLAASTTGCADLVRALCEAKADHNKANPGHWSPLQLASYDGHLEVVQLLCELGADANVANSDGNGPLVVASKRGHRAVARHLCEYLRNAQR